MSQGPIVLFFHSCGGRAMYTVVYVKFSPERLLISFMKLAIVLMSRGDDLYQTSFGSLNLGLGVWKKSSILSESFEMYNL